MHVRRDGNIRYVDKATYSALVSKGIDVINPDKKLVSPLTRLILTTTNEIVKETLFKNQLSCVWEDLDISKEEILYTKTKTQSYLKSKEYDNTQKCYDIVPLTSENNLTLLVVVEEGFLSVVTETKEALLEHLLTLLRHFYDNNTTDWIVRREYLDLRLNIGSFDLVKLRFDRD